MTKRDMGTYCLSRMHSVFSFELKNIDEQKEDFAEWAAEYNCKTTVNGLSITLTNDLGSSCTVQEGEVVYRFATRWYVLPAELFYQFYFKVEDEK